MIINKLNILYKKLNIIMNKNRKRIFLKIIKNIKIINMTKMINIIQIMDKVKIKI